LATILLVACGGDESSTKLDAAMQTADAPNQTIDAPAMTALNCGAYCAAIATACTAAQKQYDSMANCMDTCSTFAVGAAGEMTGNTLGCRATHVDLAKTGPTTHCEHAGPAGGGACGAICDGFCTLVTAKCATQWPTATACMTACGQFTSTPPFAAPETGNTAQCRLYHGTMAATSPATHCPHTQATSATCN
jgi:hypothetical protein